MANNNVKANETNENEVVYVGGIGNADEFIAKLRAGEVDLEKFRDDDYRRSFELENKVKMNPVDMVAFKVSPLHEFALQKKLFLKQNPRFNFLGRYDFVHKDRFVVEWKTVLINGTLRRVKISNTKNKDEHSKFIVRPPITK